MADAAEELLDEPVQLWTDDRGNVWLEIVDTNERVDVTLADLELLEVRVRDMIAHLRRQREAQA